MNRYVSIICIVLAVCTVLGIIAYNVFEIYDMEVYDSPSEEARSNDYLALERWLIRSEHPVNTLQFAEAENILQIDEDVIIMDSSSFNWTENTFDILSSWIEEGKHLFVYHDYWQSTFHDEEFYSFVKSFDVQMITPLDDIDDDVSSHETETSNQNIDDEEEKVLEDKKDFLAIDQTIQFTIENNRSDILSVGVDEDMINLVQVPLGKGSVTFSGIPFFMQNNNLRNNKNRMLAWNVSGAKDKDNQGILFIQNVEFKNTFFQDLLNEGNIFPLLISIFILIVICFWGFIPRFGKLILDDEDSGKPIRERFLAEGIFLKKFHSLNLYIDVYEKTIQQRFRKNYNEYIDDKNIFCSRLAEIVKLDKELIEQSLYPKRKITSRSFAKCMKTIEIILERL
jgi:hypothetical protein